MGDVRIVQDDGSTTPTQPPASTTSASETITQPEPTSEPEEAQEQEEEEEEEQPGSGMICAAVPNLNRGVTDADCATCAAGYQFWPCNEAILCTCTPSLMEAAVASGRRVRAKEHRFLGLIQQSDDVQKGAFRVDAGTVFELFAEEL